MTPGNFFSLKTWKHLNTKTWWLDSGKFWNSCQSFDIWIRPSLYSLYGIFSHFCFYRFGFRTFPTQKKSCTFPWYVEDHFAMGLQEWIINDSDDFLSNADTLKCWKIPAKVAGIVLENLIILHNTMNCSHDFLIYFGMLRLLVRLKVYGSFCSPLKPTDLRIAASGGKIVFKPI